MPVLDLSIAFVQRAQPASNSGALTLYTGGKEQKFMRVVLKMSLKICIEKMSSAVVFIAVLTMGQAVRLVYSLLSSFSAADAGNDMIFSVRIFRDQAGAGESTRTATDWVKQNLAALVEGHLKSFLSR